MNISTFIHFLNFMNLFNHGRSTHKKPPNKNTTRRTTQQTLQMVPSTMSETWATMSSNIASLMFAWAIICQYIPYEVRSLIDKLRQTLKNYLNPQVQISIHESYSERMKRSEAYALVEAYLSSMACNEAKRLRADMDYEGSDFVFSMDESQEVSDEFQGVSFLWGLRRTPVSQRASYYEQGKRYYVLTFHKKYREMVFKCYLGHVMKEGKEIRARTRQRKLYTNLGGHGRLICDSIWSHVVFQHPARLETMAMDPAMKEEIFEDLMGFSRNKDVYERAGKAWKRGYLLYGPPGTGKSTLVAAMANLLNYDLYDLELTAVRDNIELRRLLIETTSKSIIVIEDIDCSLDLTGQRKKKEEKASREGVKDVGLRKEIRRDSRDGGSSRVTLSGLLNFIDGIWSACGNERLIVFTTNHVDILDPALIRRGRMDKHIELSYCSFEGFKVLAKNHLNLETHQMFDKIGSLIGEVNITPADVAENLVPKSPQEDPEIRLSNLIRALEETEAKEAEAKKKAEESKEKSKEEVEQQEEKDTEKPE